MKILPLYLAVSVLEGRNDSRNFTLAAEELRLFVQAHHPHFSKQLVKPNFSSLENPQLSICISCPVILKVTPK